MNGQGSAGWPVPIALLGLSIIPLTAGTLRLVELAGGPSVIPSDPRFQGFPVALVAHLLGAAAFTVVGAFQFVPRIRQRHPGWHRRAGRLVAGAGMVVAGSALWLTLGYPPKPGTGPVLLVMRLVVGSASLAAIVVGVRAARARDIPTHRAWMIRSYALGLGAGTQVITEGLSGAVVGSGVLRDDLAKGAGWVINLVVSEWVIRRAATTSTTVSAPPVHATEVRPTIREVDDEKQGERTREGSRR